MEDVRNLCLKISKKHPGFYLYDEKRIRENAGRLVKNFPGVKFLYSIKANPHPGILRRVAREGLGFDAASRREVEAGERLGLGPDMIYYSAPGKTDDDIAACLKKSVATADSLGELLRMEKLAREMKTRAEAAVRINPGFTLDSDTGVSSKFGVDEEIFFENADMIKGLGHIDITGIHVHCRSQELEAGTLAAYYERMLGLAERVGEALGRKLRFVNMGGGLGIPYVPEDRLLDTRTLGGRVSEMAERFHRVSGGTQIIIETGRYVAGDAGIYVARALDKKVSRGKTYVILSGTLNGFIRPALGRLMEKAGYASPVEPLFTKPGAIPFSVWPERENRETVTLCGNLCTRTDEVAADITLPEIQPGDIVIMGNAGSYARVLSPRQFRSLEKPRQVFLRRDGSTEIYEP